MTTPDAAAFILDEIVGYVFPAALRAAAATRVADHLRDGPRSTAALAAATGASEPALHRVLRLLATRGVFTETAPGHFGLTPRAAALDSADPRSVRAARGGRPASGQGARPADDGGHAGPRTHGHPVRAPVPDGRAAPAAHRRRTRDARLDHRGLRLTGAFPARRDHVSLGIELAS